MSSPELRCSHQFAAAAAASGIHWAAAPDTPAVAELQALGVARVTVGASMCRAALAFLRGAARELGEKGTYEFARGVLSQGDVHALLA